MRRRAQSLTLILFVTLSVRCVFAQSTPSITSLTPEGAALGAAVTISGTSFGATQGSSTVTFNGVAASPTSWSDTSIAVPVPSGATMGYVVVTVGGAASNGVIFAVATSNLTLTGSLNTGRMFQTSTLLDNGKVLIAGGVDGFGYNTISSAELYNPTTATFAYTGSLNTGRIFNTATLLDTGKVLIVGGADSNWNNIGTTELYDPVAGTFSFTGSLGTPRDTHTATLLNNGKVLIVGGVSSNGDWITALAANSEIYDPVAGTFSPTGSLSTARDCHTATLLNNGHVLIVGGNDVYGNPLASAELYDPVPGTFTLTGSLNTGRAVHTATLLNNGMVLIVGGYDIDGNAVANAELYNPATGTFTVIGSLNTPRYDMGDAALLSNGMVLIAGGQDNNGNTLSSVELYDPAAGTFSVTGGMNSTRQSLTATLLNNGQVLIAAGMDYYAHVLTSAELYQPSTLTPPGLASIALSPQNSAVTVGGSLQFVATGTFSGNTTQTLESATWSTSNSSLATLSNDASNYGNALGVAPGTATVTACTGSICGSTTLTVTVAGPNITLLSPTAGVTGTTVAILGTGFGGTQGTSTVTFNGVTASSTTWSNTSITVPVPTGASSGNVVVTVNGAASDGVTFTVVASVGFSTTGGLNTARSLANATLLDNGKVLIVGGVDFYWNPIAGAELYDPTNDPFTTLNLTIPGGWSTATLLANGQVLIAGGEDSNFNVLATAEIYDPVTGNITPTGSLNTAREGHTATLLPNGQVLIAGGQGVNSNVLASAELYDPVAGTFTAAGSMNAARVGHTATRLNSGKVLIASGWGGSNDLTSAEIYDPSTGNFTATGNLNMARDTFTSTLLNNGKVLVVGSYGDPTALIELYDPTAGTFNVIGSGNDPRPLAAVTLMNNGQVLIAGGVDSNWNALSSAELYDPAAGSFTATSSLSTARESATAILLANSQVLIVGGVDTNGNTLASAELYQPSTVTPTGLVSIALSPQSPTISAGTGQQFTATGTFSDTSTQTLVSVTWNSSNNTVAAVSNDPGNRGNAWGDGEGSSSLSACAGAVCGSTTLTVTALTPGISSLSPTSGLVGTSVTISGANFGTTQEASTVTFNGIAASVSSWSSTSIVAVVPAGATTGNVVVTAYNVSSTGVLFTVLVPPSISGLSPGSGPVGTSVTINGAAFGDTQGGSTVTFNGVAGTPTQWSDTAITVPVPPNAISGFVVVTVNGLASNNAPFIVYGGALTNSPMSTGRWEGTATLLNTGLVLLAGGYNSDLRTSASAELYDPAAGIFSLTGDLNTGRLGQTASLLYNGQVLVAGGMVSGGLSGPFTPQASAELYDPATGSFTEAASMTTSRSDHTATVLNNGKVLIAGGYDANSNVLSSAELFDPATGTFTLTGSLNTGRYTHTATLMNTGMVLLTGGYDSNGNLLSSAELYDPVAGTFAPTGGLYVARYLETATLLNNGKVLIAGGSNASGQELPSTESYDPAAGTFSVGASLGTAREGHVAALLNNGTVMITGGWDTNNNALASTEIYDPVAGAFAPTGGLNTPRGQPTATLLLNGQVLIAGGLDNFGSSSASAELYQPATLTPPGLVSIALSPVNPSITAGVSQRFTATGTFSDNSTQQLASATWSTSDNTLAMVTSDVTNYGTAFGVAPGSPTVNACTGSVCGSTTLTVGPQTALPPAIQGLAPGSAMAGSWVAISGANFGAAQGSSTISFGGAAATVVGWSDTAIFAVVPNSLTPGQTVSVIVTTSAGGSTPADFLPVSTAAPYNVSPQEVNLLVGQTRTISVTDRTGNALTGLDWATSNSSVASLSTDDPPIITAVAAGTAIVYVVGMPILVTVYSGTSLPTGTPIWSVPVGSGGAGSVSIAPAVPSASGVDVFAVDGNTGAVTALSSDGRLVWKSLPHGAQGPFPVEGDFGMGPAQVIPDFSGNAILKVSTSEGLASYTHTVNTVDPSTGIANVIYTFSTPVHVAGAIYDDVGSTQVIIPHPSGVLFVQDNGMVSVLNPSTAQQVAGIGLEASNFNDIVYPPQVGSMIVAGDGNAYLPYAYTLQTNSMSGTNVDTQTSNYLKVLWVRPDGSSGEVALGSWSGDVLTDNQDNVLSCTGSTMLLDSLGPAMGNLPVITNAAIGAAVFANLSITPACGGAAQTFEQMSFVSQSGLASQVNVAAPEFVPALQREDGSYIGSDYSGNLFAIGLDGSVAWQQQIATPPLGWGAAPFVNPLYATADGGAIVTTTTQCPTNIVSNYQCTPQLGTLYTVDQNGNVTSQTADTGAVYSWSGQWYDPPAAGGSLNLLNLAAVNLAGTFWAFAFASGGSPSGTGAAVRHVDIELFWCTAGLCKSNGAGDVNYIYYQDNPSYLPSSTINLTPGQILTVKTEAFKALNAAFNGYNYPVQIGIMGTGTNQVQVTGDQPPMGENGVSCGETKYAGFSVVSWDYYLASMEQAQYALNLELKVPTDGLLAAIGRGIGNTAAHELGHQFNLEGMHDGSIGTYNGGDCNGAKDPSQFTGTTKSGTTIKWGPAAAKSLHQYIFGW